MIRRAVLREKFNNNRTILSNFSYLVVLRAFTLLFPLITYPYLLRVLGFEVYGSVIFAQTIALNIGILVNFGFNISGTRDIACHRESASDLSRIVSNIYSVKLLIWVACLLLYFTLIWTIPFLRQDKWLYVISFFLTFNELLFPTWFFQGIEKMKYITFINIGVRLLFVAAIFITVRTRSDYMMVPVLNAAGALFGGVVALYVVTVRERVRLVRTSISELKHFFKDSLPLFVSTLSIQVYVNINKVLVGSFLGMTDVAIYDLGEKITTLIKIPIAMISQATFPRISREKSIAFVNKVMLLTVGCVTGIYVVLFFGADTIVRLMSGTENTQAVDVMRILAFSTIISATNLFLGGNRLVPFGYQRVYMLNAIINCTFFLLGYAVLILSHAITIYSVSYLYLATEICVLILNLYRCHKYKLLCAN